MIEQLFEIIILAIVQGIAEFLPISSSGHLVIVEHLLGITEPKLLCAIILHCGTLVAVIAVLWGYLFTIIRDSKAVLQKRCPFTESSFKVALFALVATIPAVIVALFFKKSFENAFSSTILTASFLLINGCILYVTFYVKNHTKEVEHFTLTHALLIGLAQCVALFPGISRSGATITCALLCGMSPLFAFRFSFLLAIPAIIGAFVFEVKEFLTLSKDIFFVYGVGFFVSIIVGYFSLLLLRKLVKQNRLYYFSWYCWIIGILVLIFR
ncbi:MAG: undecaprenyl-diphosphate phosphatase [Candidatus Omnitrophica bacterium]|nr:undecaprenyl-diphosphate phosphatase [Candidatus Omnitrophota bacterium]